MQDGWLMAHTTQLLLFTLTGWRSYALMPRGPLCWRGVEFFKIRGGVTVRAHTLSIKKNNSDYSTYQGASEQNAFFNFETKERGAAG